MKRFSLIVACIITLTQLTVGQTPPGRCHDCGSSISTVTEELTKLDREIDAAFERADVTALQRLLAEDMVNVNPDGTISKRSDILRDVKPQAPGSSLSITAASIQVYSFGDTTIITSIKTAKWVRPSGTKSEQTRETNTYARRDGRWQLIASESHAPPPYSARDVHLNLKVDDAQIAGNKKAKVVLIEFADYQCDYCRRFAAEIGRASCRERVYGPV